MKQTAMQELRNDLVEAKEKSITVLNDMSNEIIRNYCQEAVKLTIESIIKRIDDELLEMEEQQIVDAITQYQIKHNKIYSEQGILNVVDNAIQYYVETFKQQEQ
jgi:hypothetical protein